MTAFARSEKQTPQGGLYWEIKSVNQRHLDCHFRLSDELRSLEPQVRVRLSHYLKRGKVECQLRFIADSLQGGNFSIDETLVKQLSHASRSIDGILYNPSTVSSLDIMKWPGVLQSPEIDLANVQESALALLEEALQQLVENRLREGACLQQAIELRAEGIKQQVDIIRHRMPIVREALKTRLQQRIAELKEQLYPTRLEQEVVLLVQKSDVDEELDRLDAHLKEVKHIFDQGGVCGRRLDFLMQEFNREANTIASKSTDQDVTRAALELKVLIEQAREQIQNIE